MQFRWHVPLLATLCAAFLVLGCRRDPLPAAPFQGDAFVDYVAATNLRHSQGVTPEDNWEVVVRRIWGPLDWDDASDVEYYRRLGIPRLAPDPPAGTYYRSWHVGKDGTDFEKQLESQYAKMEGPFRTEEFPELARWLETNRGFLDRMVAGSHVTRHYIPHVMSAEAHARKVGELNAFYASLANDKGSAERVTAALVQTFMGNLRQDPSPLARWHVNEMTQQSREVGRMLIMRAYWRIGEGDTAGARSDLLAIHRVARLVSQGMLNEWLIGNMFETLACHGDAALLQSGQLTRPSCEAYLAELNRLPQLVAAVQLLDVGWRHEGLDALQNAGRRRQELLTLMKSTDLDRRTRRAIEQIDWVEATRLFNQKFDLLVDASKGKDAMQRLTKVKEVGPRRRTAIEKELIAEMVAAAKENESLTEFMAQLYFDRYGLDLTRIESRHVAILRVCRTVLAAQAHRLATGSYPTDLQTLEPALGEIPIDPFSGKPLHMARDANQFVVYSIGENQIDDGGDRDYRDKDDISVRLDAGK